MGELIHGSEILEIMTEVNKPAETGKTFDKSELRARLTTTQYQVTQEHGTEKQFSNLYYKHNEVGMYRCVVCESISSLQRQNMTLALDGIHSLMLLTRETSGVGQMPQ